jgi:phage/plasmid-associated DNA primase
LQEVTASSFLTICIEKGIFLVGSGSNGKSTFLHILRELHPRNAAVRVDKLEGQFAMSAIVNKTAIFATEMPKVLTNATQDVLKAIISRDPVQCEAKGCNPYTTVPRGTFFGSVNAWFSVSSHEHGFWRKVCAIPFSVQLAEGDKSRVPDFHRLITEDAAEMAQVLDWILAGAVRLVQRGGLPDKLPAAVEELARQNRVSSDTVAAYLEDRDVQANELVHTGKNEIYDDYREFVLVEAGKKPVAAEEFWKRVRERFPGMVFSHLTILGKKVRTASMVVENIRPIRSLMPPCSLNDTPFPDGSADGRSVPNLTGAHIPTKNLRMQAP